jgi:branched-chain amino acid transport system substrate-binding protein
VAVVAALAVIAVTACTDDGAAPTPASLATATSTTEVRRVDDGILRVGIMLPETGDGAAVGGPLIKAALSASAAINEAGGVLGSKIEVIGNVDEGSSPSTTREAIATLVEQGVDAVIGPASSTIALATVPRLMEAGILTCSPTATALALDDLPDRSLFFRTAPSDSLQAIAIAEQAERTGALSAVVVNLDDAYGGPLADATIAALRGRGLAVDARVPFSGDDEFLDDEATAVTDSSAGVIIVLADAEQGTRMIGAIGEATSAGPGEDAPPIIVNDAMRKAPSDQQITALAPSLRERIVGMSPMASTGAPDEPPGAFAVNAFDCMNLIALAAAQAKSDDPVAIAEQVSDVSEGGVSCRLFAECIALVQSERNVDYDGPDGPLQIGANGDPARARFDRWGWGPDGLDRSLPIGPLAVTG